MKKIGGTLNNHFGGICDEMKCCRIKPAVGKPGASGLARGVCSLAIGLLGGFLSLCPAMVGPESGRTG